MYLQRQLAQRFSPGIRHRGVEIFSSRRVTIVSGDRWGVTAKVRGSRVYEVELSRDQDEIHVSCDCPNYDEGAVCKHIWAKIVEADQKSYLLGAIGGGPVRMVADRVPGEFDEDEIDDEDDDDPEGVVPRSGFFRRAGAQPAKQPPIPKWRTLLDPLQRVPYHGETGETWRADREILYIVDAQATLFNQVLCLKIENRERLQNGNWGKLKALRATRRNIREMPDPLDREILTSLCGASQPYSAYYEEQVPTLCHLKHAAQDILLPKICATGRCYLRTMATEILEPPALEWDEGDAWRFRLVVDRQGENWILRGVLQRGDERMNLTEPAILLDGGIAIARGKVARLSDGGSFPWIALLRKEKQISVPTGHGPELVAHILQSAQVPEIDWPEDLRVEEVAVVPRPVLKFSESKTWSKQVMRGKVAFDYAGVLIPFDGQARGLYQPEEKRYLRRDLEAERAAVQPLAGLRLKPAQAYGDPGPHWGVAPKKLPGVDRELIEAGLHVEAESNAVRPSSRMPTEV